MSGLFHGVKKAAQHLSCMCWTYLAAPQTSVVSHSEILSARGRWWQGLGADTVGVRKSEVLASLGCLIPAFLS